MKDETRFNILKYLVAFVLAGFGCTYVWMYSNGWVVVGVVLMIWSNNIERTKYKP